MDQQPEFYELEFEVEANFWTAGDASTRRVYLMPLSSSSEFLAFGVLVPSDRVLFVARGRVRDDLPFFIVQMKQAGARVELHAHPPLPGHIIRDYIKGRPHEQKETEAPPKVPNLVGEVEFNSGAGTASLTSTSSLWPTSDAERKVLLVPVPNSQDYLAFGMLRVNLPEHLWSVAFVARLGSSLQDFITRMEQEHASVELNPTPLPGTLQTYMQANFGGSQPLAQTMENPSGAEHRVLIA